MFVGVCACVCVCVFVFVQISSHKKVIALLVQDKDSMAVGYKTACWTTSKVEGGALEAFVQAVTTFRC